MIKAAFFDIDGTLVSLRTKAFPSSAQEAIRRLRARGILCFVATGRSKFEIAQEHLLEDVAFDGYLTNNGQDAYGADGALLYGKALHPDDAAAVYRWVKETGCACWMVSASHSRINLVNERVSTAMEAIHTRLPEIGDLTPMLQAPVYKIVLFLPREEMSAPLALAPHSRMTQWFRLGHDLISKDGGKRAAMLGILQRYGLTAENAIAFGDSENDIEMLQAAKIGVAMGNATPECIAAADYVTADCDEDGLVRALSHFGLYTPPASAPAL